MTPLAPVEDIMGAMWLVTRKDPGGKRRESNLRLGIHGPSMTSPRRMYLATGNANDYPSGLWDDTLGLAKEDLTEDLKKALGAL
jgi:hypothetical protein